MADVEPARAVRDALDAASRGLVEREEIVELIGLAAVAREHVLLVGPPGTAKSEVVRRVARALGGTYFEYLLGRFTEPSEIFGPVDLQRLRDGVVETRTSGMLPEAEIAFLDEVFLGSTAILNTLLTLLNERTFRRGHTSVKTPLRVCVGASNRLPEDPLLEAFADRFLVQAHLSSLPDPSLEALLAEGWSLREMSEEPIAALGDLDHLAAVARSMTLVGVRRQIAAAVRTLRSVGVHLSDRRVVRVQRLVAAAAALDGRTEATQADLWPIVYAVPGQTEQALARDALRNLLRSSFNRTLPIAVEAASAGPEARAGRLVRDLNGLLEDGAADDPIGWRLRLEGVAREIDAGFAISALPAELQEARGRLLTALGSA